MHSPQQTPLTESLNTPKKGWRLSDRPRFWGLLGIVAAVIIGSIITFATPLIGVSVVDISGTHTLTPQEVRTVANVPQGTPLARINAGEVSRRVETLPAVARAEVFRAWPQTIRISVTERIGVALAASRPKGFVVVDADGVPFRPLNENEAMTLPIIDVPRVSPRDPATTAALRVASILDGELRTELDKVVASTATDVQIRLYDGRTIFWGEATDNRRKLRVALAVIAQDGEYIDVSAPDVVTVR